MIKITSQRWTLAELDALQAKVEALKRLQAETVTKCDAAQPRRVENS